MNKTSQTATRSDVEIKVAIDDSITTRFSPHIDDSLIASMEIGFWDWNLRDGNLHINKQIADLFQVDLTKTQPTFELFMQRLHKDDRERIRNRVTELLSSPSTNVIIDEYHLAREDGTYVWLISKGSITEWDSHDKPVRITGILVDITRQKETEQNLLRDQRNFSHAQKIAHLGTWEWDFITGITKWSDELFNIFGIDDIPESGTIPIKEVFRHILLEDREPFRKLLRNRDENLVMEFRLQRQDGAIRTLYTKGEVVRDNDGQITGMLGTAQDITDRKREIIIRDVLLHISQAANTIPNLLELLEVIHAQLSRLINAANFYVALYNPRSETYTFPFHHDLREEINREDNYPLEGSLTDYVRRTGKPLWGDDATHREMMKQELVGDVGAPAPIWIGVPLKTANDVIGVVAIQSYDNPNAYIPEDMHLLEFVSDHIAMAIVHHQADEALKESRAILDFSYEATGDSLWDWDISNGDICFNRTWWQMFGYEENEFLPTFDSWMNLIHPNDLERVDQLLQEYLVGNLSQFTVEYRAKTKQGRWRWILTRGRILEREADGRPRRMIGTNVNIDRIKRTEEALRESESQFRKLIEYSPLPILVCNLDGVIEILNSRFLHLFQYDQQDIPTIDDWWRQAFPAPHYRQQIVVSWQQKVNLSGQDRAIQALKDVQIICKNGTILDTEIRFSRIGNRELVIFLDNTERKKQEEERKKLDARIQENQRLESIGLLAGGIAHDFNNLLAEIIGNIDMIHMKCREELPAHKKNLDNIQKSAERMSLLTSQMLAYSGQGQFIIEPLDLSILVKDVSTLLKSSISDYASLELDLIPALPNIAGDSLQIRQLVTNLVLNASDALDGKAGKIKISTSLAACSREVLEESVLTEIPEAGDFIKLVINDNGIGIEEGLLTRIFEPFYTTKFTGRGLGLAAVLGIIRAHKGAITVTSKVGVGTTFTIFLPVKQH